VITQRLPANYPKLAAIDPNYEATVALRPDLVILLKSHQDAQLAFKKLGIRTLSIPNQHASDVQRAIALIGAEIGAQARANTLVEQLKHRTQAVQAAIKDQTRPRVLISIGRETATDNLAGIYIAGKDGFYDEIIELAGGVNAYQDTKVLYPQVAAEGLLQLNPEVIVDLISPVRLGTKDVTKIKQQWQRLRSLEALRQQRIHVIVGDHALRPGPRYIEFLEQLARLLHPEAFVQ